MLRCIRFIGAVYLGVAAVLFAVMAEPVLTVICGGLCLMCIFAEEW